MTFNPHTPEDRAAMLAAIGVESFEELVRVVPEAVRYPDLTLPRLLTEMEAAQRLAADLGGTGVPLRHCGDLEAAMLAASAAAEPGDVVLLSPACASYDQYRDYEERGDHFRSLLPQA